MNNCMQVLISQHRSWVKPDKMSLHLLTYSVFILILLFSLTCYEKDPYFSHNDLSSTTEYYMSYVK